MDFTRLTILGIVILSQDDRDLEDVRESLRALEGRLSRVVGVRRVD